VHLLCTSCAWRLNGSSKAREAEEALIFALDEEGRDGGFEGFLKPIQRPTLPLAWREYPRFRAEGVKGALGGIPEACPAPFSRIRKLWCQGRKAQGVMSKGLAGSFGRMDKTIERPPGTDPVSQDH
jgi:hypothetical protein